MNEDSLVDTVPRESAQAREIGFSIAERYNASDILFANLERGLGAKVAVYSDQGNATYQELCDGASRFGNALLGLGLPRGSRVAMVLNDTRFYAEAVFGAMRAGMVPVLLNTASPADLVKYFVADSASPVLLIESQLAHMLGAGFEAGLRHLEHIVVVGGDATPSTPVACHGYDELVAGESARLHAADTHRDDMAFWMYSSGSTGRPKGIVHLHHDMLYTYQSYARHILSIGESDVCFSPPKIFFAYGFGNSLTFPFAAGASTVLLAGRPAPDAVFRTIERFRPTLFFGLPTLYNALIDSEAARHASLDSVRLCLSAAEVLSEDLALRWRDRFGHSIIEGLGSTEVLHIYLSNTPDRQRSGSAGLGVPGYLLKLVEDDAAAATGEQVGSLWVQGDSQSPGYWNKPDKTADTMRDGWIVTGDRFRRDVDGFYYFLGRADDLIKVSGQWVYPLEVEHCLNEHESVRECAVLGARLADGRMTLRAYVVLKAGLVAGEDMNRCLQSWVKEMLLPYKYPREIRYLDVLPKTGTGKIDRQSLQTLPEQAPSVSPDPVSAQGPTAGYK